ncbi:hypothetical protein [Algoriphagus taiwanensis]|uniref:Uncharacterized protein n=1 Tax=Algoriphagus taiwanensis TaxID=1445656 RepID=A0ABQ6Q4V2_9BACT|nr:hypothetical protein Ataiwa_33760 [Algoriphagus taiwanensis]
MNIKLLLPVFVFVVISGFTALAQDKKVDTILKINGDELQGTVKEISPSSIKFSYAGEELTYEVPKSDIIKITFASGRIEFFNKPNLSSESGNAPAGAKPGPEFNQPQDHHNKVAILPFHYLIDKQNASEEITYQVQMEAYSYLNRHIGALTLQDVNETNALLIRNGVNEGNMRGFTMGEICNILGVEYVIQGTITQDRTTVTSSSSSSYSQKSSTSSDSKNNFIGAINGSSKGSASTYSSSQQNYSTAISMNIYTDKGENIYSQSHTGFWPTTDAYKITLQYLLKRTPIYRK